MRLLDCFGFATAPFSLLVFEAAPGLFFVAAVDRFRSYLGFGLGGLCGAGEARRKTLGEGIVIETVSAIRPFAKSAGCAQSH